MWFLLCALPNYQEAVTTLEPCPFEFGLRKFALDPVVVIFFKNAENITSGGLILSLAKFGLIPYSKIFR